MSLDEVRFGAQRILNVREGLTANEAVRRAESWLREHQVRGTHDVLIITGRGNQSIGGVPVIRPAMEKLLFSLRRRGVVSSHRDHNPGAFAVELAPIRALTEAPARKRESSRTQQTPPDIQGLSRETLGLLRDLAERSLDELGVARNEGRVVDEMHRHLRLFAPGLTAGVRMEEQLKEVLRTAIAQYD